MKIFLIAVALLGIAYLAGELIYLWSQRTRGSGRDLALLAAITTLRVSFIATAVYVVARSL